MSLFPRISKIKSIALAGLILFGLVPVLPSQRLSAATICDADINQDFAVDLTDYSLLAKDFFKLPPSNPRSDINKDSIVDVSDYSLLAAKFFLSCGVTGPSFETGVYTNYFRDIGKTDAEAKAKLDTAWNQLFYGDNNNQRVYYPVGTDMAYILDVGNGIVPTEGMSYGMMISVQLNKKEEFDRLWKWAYTYMLNKTGPRTGYFAWKCNTNGDVLDQNPAPDGEEYFTTALLFAAGKWPGGTGIFNYKAEAQKILDAMLHKEDNGVIDSVYNMFNKTQKQVVFTPYGSAANLTDPSYHLPAFYELWSKWANKDNQFWSDAAATSRSMFPKFADSNTGLSPNFANFDGTPSYFSSYGPQFSFDAWRVAMNVALDYMWFGKSTTAVAWTNKLINFFSMESLVPGKILTAININ
jgi:oligosaccharide reducing-end xylanase